MCDVCLEKGLSRRHALMLAGAGMLTASPLMSRMAHAQPVSAASTPDAALALLVEGNARYAATSRAMRFSAACKPRLGQAPFAAILGARIPGRAGLAFDQNPGDQGGARRG